VRDKVRLYKFYPLDSAIRNLEQKRLKVSLLDELNDPFEFLNFQLPDRKIRDAWLNTRAESFADKGIICFSENWRNPLMWSHYAANHSGLALGFDVPINFAIKIEYVKDRPPFKYFDITEPQRLALVEKALRTKFSYWEYEGERRILVPLGKPENIDGRNLYFHDFNEDLSLREVVIGARSDATSSQIRRAFGSHHLRVVTARLAFNSFAIVKQNNVKLKK
jgi:hypothetical protein